MSKEKVLDVLDMLPIDYLLLFSEYIMESLSIYDSDIQETWEDEVQRRIDSVHHGSCALIPSEDIHNTLYRLFKDKKTGDTRQQFTNKEPMTLTEVIEEIATYSDTERIKIRTAIQKTLRPPDPEIEQAWAEEADRRLDEIENGEVETIPGDQVIRSIRERLSE
ncbi:addiction module protein [Fodinibius salsisoli]|uniref:Addiction module protein n=1 Tax=Fodinibius salsisoli TaxID=2820877 RepID=A0ABT3PH38_9BACT|nr:addiction module protein [Fodinibius salsisoli]MCW9705224.1 addiction module protein [Fodinibius salsisoli]